MIGVGPRTKPFSLPPADSATDQGPSGPGSSGRPYGFGRVVVVLA